MKKLLLAIGLTTTVAQVQAQGDLAVKKFQLNAGLGLSSRGMPVYVGFDYGANKHLTVGAEVAYRSYSNAGYNFGITSVGANANYHFNDILNIDKNFDFYAGLNLGYLMWNLPGGYVGDYSSGLGLGAQIGGRYYFNNKLGLNLEFAGGNKISGGKFGITVKL
jgi:outer membrane immunogenic protein